MAEPSHPGVYLYRSFVPQLDMTVTDLAGVLKVTRPTLSNLLNGNARMSPEMAMRFEKAFGLRMETLLLMQAKYDGYLMRQREDEIGVSAYETPAAKP